MRGQSVKQELTAAKFRKDDEEVRFHLFWKNLANASARVLTRKGELWFMLRNMHLWWRVSWGGWRSTRRHKERRRRRRWRVARRGVRTRVGHLQMNPNVTWQIFGKKEEKNHFFSLTDIFSNFFGLLKTLCEETFLLPRFALLLPLQLR